MTSKLLMGLGFPAFFVMEERHYPRLFYHPKTQSYYLGLGEATCSTNGREEEQSVLYLSLSKKTLHYREVSEFYDGRFVLATEQQLKNAVR